MQSMNRSVKNQFTKQYGFLCACVLAKSINQDRLVVRERQLDGVFTNQCGVEIHAFSLELSGEGFVFARKLPVQSLEFFAKREHRYTSVPVDKAADSRLLGVAKLPDFRLRQAAVFLNFGNDLFPHVANHNALPFHCKTILRFAHDLDLRHE